MGSAAFDAFAAGIRIVASSRGRASITGVVAFIPMNPAVVVVLGFGSGLVGGLETKLGILIGDLGYLL